MKSVFYFTYFFLYIYQRTFLLPCTFLEKKSQPALLKSSCAFLPNANLKWTSKKAVGSWNWFKSSHVLWNGLKLCSLCESWLNLWVWMYGTNVLRERRKRQWAKGSSPTQTSLPACGAVPLSALSAECLAVQLDICAYAVWNCLLLKGPSSERGPWITTIGFKE